MGLIKGDRHVTVDKDTPMTNMMLSAMDTLGVQADKLGDCNRPSLDIRGMMRASVIGTLSVGLG